MAAVEFGPGAVPGIASQVLGFWCAVPGRAKVRADCPGVPCAGLVACLDLSPAGSWVRPAAAEDAGSSAVRHPCCLLPTDFIGVTCLSGS